MTFKKSDKALLFLLIICDFFSKYNRKVFLTNQKLEKKHYTNFQNKIYSKFQKIKKKKKGLDLVELKRRTHEVTENGIHGNFAFEAKV